MEHTQNPHVLIVEDEPSLLATLNYSLTQAGITVTQVSTGQDALLQTKAHYFDLMILDVGLPDITGFEVLDQVRAYFFQPILMLTARSDEVDKILGLEKGADDYVTKPFSPKEVVARVHSLMRGRKLYAGKDYASKELTMATAHTMRLVDDVDLAQMRLDGQVLKLTRYEYLLLQYFMQHPMRVFSRAALMQAVWAHDVSGDRTVDTHIKSLRAKMRHIDAQLDMIETHRGFGYRFVPDGVIA